MTTRTPISEATLNAGAPAGVPDVAELARMANALFAAVPGARLPFDPPAGGGAPELSAAAREAGSIGESPAFEPGTPAALAAAGASPDALRSLPVTGGPVAGPALGPVAGLTTGSRPTDALAGITGGFYFLDFAAPALSGATSTARQAASVAPLGSAIPGVPGLPEVPAARSVGAVPAAATQFYFLDPVALDRTAGKPASGFTGAHPAFNVEAIRRDFPILSERVNGRPLVWLDNAATTQKPQAVIDRLADYYAHENSNIHRAAHELAARSTDAYENARRTVQRFLGAGSPDEIIFVRGATEAINLIAQSWGRRNVGAGDEILVSHLEHHANIVPWQQLAAEKGAKLKVVPVDDSGQILLEEYQRLLNERTKIVSMTHVSNALGTVVPVKQVVDLAHRAGATVLIDGAQSVSHMPVDVRALDTDFYVFSGHKIFGPTGIGAVYGKADVLDAMPPWQGGGNMIQHVTFERTVYQGPPARFEAGTGNIADAVGLGAALEYLERIGMDLIARYEHDLLVYATAGLNTVPGLRLIGTAADKASVLSFVLEGHDPVSVGKALNEEGIAVRAGHHCAEPILNRFGVSATVRPSLAFYNTCGEIDALVAALLRLTGKAPRR